VIEWASACREGRIASKSKTVRIRKGIQRRPNIEWEGKRWNKWRRLNT
jgi:hypothetical protein